MSHKLVLGLVLSFRILIISNIDIVVLDDFEQFFVYSQGQTKVQLAGVVNRSLQEFGQLYRINLYLQDCSIKFKNKTNWFCGFSVCFYLQLTSPFSDFFGFSGSPPPQSHEDAFTEAGTWLPLRSFWPGTYLFRKVALGKQCGGLSTLIT